MCCVTRLLLGTCLLVLGPAEHRALGQCPSECLCLGNLQHVTCVNKGLKAIPQVSEATQLLDLQGNNLGSIQSGAFSHSRGLMSLHMQQCQLQEIEAQAFKGLKKLTYLYLSNNKIRTIKPGAFDDLTKLTYLYLDGNQISELPKGLFSPMINLFVLQLNNNKLRELRSGTFTGAKNLRWLHMSGNELTTLQPSSLEEVENLAVFHLERNRLTAYPSEAMSKLRVVEELKLGGNSMRMLPDNAFRSFGRYMEKLHLDNMGLEKLSSGVFNGVTAVKFVYLDNNKLKSLPQGVLLNTITNITLTNNPWNCACQLAPLLRWLDSRRMNSTYPDAVCASPHFQKGKQFREITPTESCKTKKNDKKKSKQFSPKRTKKSK